MRFYIEKSPESGDLTEVTAEIFAKTVNEYGACSVDSDWHVSYYGLDAKPEDHFLLLASK